MAGRPSVDLDVYMDKLIEQYNGGRGKKPSQLSRVLLDDHHVSVSASTIQRQLSHWGVLKSNTDHNDARLHARIKILFFTCCLSEADMLYALNHEGYNIGKRALQDIRLELGLLRRIGNNRPESDEGVIRKVVQEELDKGRIEGYGRGLLYTHFRSQMHIISR